MDDNDIVTPALEKSGFSVRYIQYATTLIAQYKGETPFSIYLKKYFSLNKKHGSKDRRIVSALCFGYFRLGQGVIQSISLENKILLGYFLTQSTLRPGGKILSDEWSAHLPKPMNQKLDLVKEVFDVKKVFPLAFHLSKEINATAFAYSFLLQPKVFIRVRPGFDAEVVNTFNKAAIDFELMGKNCLAFAADTKIDLLLTADKKTVIQDYSSQRVADILLAAQSYLPENINCWDCCAGSGGKSMLAIDTLKNVTLTVSDKRKQILENLKKRFAAAGIKKYQSLVSDIAVENMGLPHQQFDLIIADVPCTGSGTWARTPEQLLFFQENEIEKYTLLQKNILKNALKSLKPGGCLIYITCSIFEKENEGNVKFILETLGLELKECSYFKGYEMQADTLFGALFTKNK